MDRFQFAFCKYAVLLWMPLLASVVAGFKLILNQEAKDETITSPNYPSSYPPGQNITWQWAVKTGFWAVVFNKDFQLDKLRNSDRLIIDGGDQDGPTKYTSSDLPVLPYLSEGPKLTIRFISDDEMESTTRGFKLLILYATSTQELEKKVFLASRKRSGKSDKDSLNWTLVIIVAFSILVIIIIVVVATIAISRQWRRQRAAPGDQRNAFGVRRNSGVCRGRRRSPGEETPVRREGTVISPNQLAAQQHQEQLQQEQAQIIQQNQENQRSQQQREQRQQQQQHQQQAQQQHGENQQNNEPSNNSNHNVRRPVQRSNSHLNWMARAEMSTLSLQNADHGGAKPNLYTSTPGDQSSCHPNRSKKISTSSNRSGASYATDRGLPSPSYRTRNDSNDMYVNCWLSENTNNSYSNSLCTNTNFEASGDDDTESKDVFVGDVKFKPQSLAVDMTKANPSNNASTNAGESARASNTPILNLGLTVSVSAVMVTSQPCYANVSKCETDEQNEEHR